MSHSRLPQLEYSREKNRVLLGFVMIRDQEQQKKLMETVGNVEVNEIQNRKQCSREASRLKQIKSK